MDTGFSVFLGEYFDAAAVEYRDCEPFQIVCPVCSEPVFKAHRKTASGEGAHYLSHYRLSSAYAAECELRAKRFNAGSIVRHNRESRHQKLEYFLGVFRNALERDPWMKYDRGIAHSHRQLGQSLGWRRLRQMHFEQAREDFIRPETFRNAAEHYLAEAQLGSLPRTGFSESIQLRIATDLMQMLGTDAGRPNYNALFNHAALYLVASWNREIENPNLNANAREVMYTLVRMLSRLKKSDPKGMRLIAQMFETPLGPPYLDEPGNYLFKAWMEIAHEMSGVMVRLPYYDLLKAHSTLHRPGHRR